MRLRGHVLTSAVVLLNVVSWRSVVAGWLNLLLGLFGAVFPDVVEVRLIPALTFGRVRVYFAGGERLSGVLYFRHRGFWHDVGFYLVLWVLAFVWDWLRPFRVDGGVVLLNLFFLGALLHLVVDMGSVSGVPVFGRVVSFGLYCVGELSEHVVVLVGCCVFLLLFVVRLEWEAISGQVAVIVGDSLLWVRGVVIEFWWVLPAVVGAVVGLWLLGRRVLSGFRSVVVEGDGEVVSMLELVGNYRYGPGRSVLDEGVVGGEAVDGEVVVSGGVVLEDGGDGVGVGEVSGGDVEVEQEVEQLVGDEVDGGVSELVVPEWRHGRSGELYGLVESELVGDVERRVVVDVLSLLEGCGDVSSVHGSDMGSSRSYDVLSKVSLYEHSVGVALRGVKVLRSELPASIGVEQYLFSVVVACLLHDIGKADELFEGRAGYSRDDHAVDGARFAGEFLAERGVDEKKVSVICDAIRRHHRARDDDEMLVCRVVVRADREVRREEYEKYLDMEKKASVGEEVEKEHVIHRDGEGKEGVIPDDFPHARLVKVLRECANFPKNRRPTEINEWRSVSQPDGYVYYKLDFLSSLIAEVAYEAGYRDFWLVDGSDEEGRKRLRVFCDYWRERGYLHGAVRDGFYSQRFRVFDGVTRKEFVVRLVPVSVDLLGVKASELEAERALYPRLKQLEVRGVAGRGEGEGDE